MKRSIALIVCCMFQATHTMMERAFGLETKKRCSHQFLRSQRRFLSNQADNRYINPTHSIGQIIVSVPIGLVAGYAIGTAAEVVAGSGSIVYWTGMGSAAIYSGIVGGKKGMATTICALVACDHIYRQIKMHNYNKKMLREELKNQRCSS